MFLVAQTERRLRFAAEAREKLRILREFFGQNF